MQLLNRLPEKHRMLSTHLALQNQGLLREALPSQNVWMFGEISRVCVGRVNFKPTVHVPTYWGLYLATRKTGKIPQCRYQNCPKGGRGGGQWPFETFPKFHLFWKGKAFQSANYLFSKNSIVLMVVPVIFSLSQFKLIFMFEKIHFGERPRCNAAVSRTTMSSNHLSRKNHLARKNKIHDTRYMVHNARYTVQTT